METRQQGQTMFTGILLLIGTVIIVQLWLVGASMDALLAHETEILIPAAIISFLGLLLNAGLLYYIHDFDKRVRRSNPAR